jgi:ketol-acid reductoisomerase
MDDLTQSLIRLVDENGMDWMYANCSATTQRGALDWRPRLKEAVSPVFKELYQRVKDGDETRRVLEACSAADYQQTFTAELGNSEMWRAGKATRELRPKEPAKTITADTKGVGGCTSN